MTSGLLIASVALPLFGAALILLVPQVTPVGHLIGTGTAFGSFACAVALFVRELTRSGPPAVTHVFTWLQADRVTVRFDLAYDHLSALFLLLITGVGSLIHLYSIGYMASDPRRSRFFAYLNLFIAAMLTLVLSDSYTQLFLGWEGVGLASYLLIGFWQHKPAAAAAALKAFVMNRVGDVGLALAIALCFARFGTTDFTAIASRIPTTSGTTVTVLGLLLLLGACGKSAQVPLQGWLLDAMEGPTPVSALIHAATMVTAGVYLVVRSGFVYDVSSVARAAVVGVAVVTLMWGAAVSCVKDDIKKVLAGSTMSQIGYMMLAAGLGPVGYPFAIFHLLTHGFFKANMFLGAGSVMHAMDDDVDMKHYGALRAVLPTTFTTFACGYLAIIGFPGFSGFWSKDKILEACFHQHWYLGLLATAGAGVTAYYMTRLMLLTFFTNGRWRPGVHPHESPRVMTVPLIVLAALSAAGGLLLAGDWIVRFLRPVVGPDAPSAQESGSSWLVSAAAVMVVAAGASIAYLRFGRGHVSVAPTPYLPVTPIDQVALPPFRRLVRALRAFDLAAIDGVVTGGPVATVSLLTWLRRAQNGFVRSYAMTMLGGSLLVVLSLLIVAAQP